MRREQPDVIIDATAFRSYGEEMTALALKWGKSLMTTVNAYKVQLDTLSDAAKKRSVVRSHPEAKPNVPGVATILQNAEKSSLTNGIKYHS